MQSTTTSESASVAPRADADSEPSTSKLVSGMASDVKQLGESYLELLRLELARTLRKTAQLVAATLLAAVGLVLLAVGSALALHENSALSLGGAYAIVGGALGASALTWMLAAARLQRGEVT